MPSDPNALQQKLWILAAANELQAVKDALIEQGVLNEDEPIVYNPRIVRQEFDILSQFRKVHLPNESDSKQPEKAAHVALPTILDVADDDSTATGSSWTTSLSGSSILEFLGSGFSSNIIPATRNADSGTDARHRKKKSFLTHGNDLARAIRHWLYSLPPSLLATLPSEDQLLESSTWRFTKYTPLLILPAGTFRHAPWPSVFASLPTEDIQALYQCIARGLGVTHIAEQAPIPLHVSRPENGVNRQASALQDTDDAIDHGDAHGKDNDNVLRSPLGLRPIFGAFGPLPIDVKEQQQPNEAAFAAALWVSTTQHGVAQVWAPLYTMFANGNVNEKRRVRELAARTLRDTKPAAASASAPAAIPATAMAAADLYAGIGYFAFAYAKAGYAPVLCWELNAWSIEGLRRGAERNGWSCTIFAEDEEITEAELHSALESTFVVFHESNARAPTRLQRLRPLLPPIRHVNCGYLPSSRPSWGTALDLLDRADAGWIHVHENCAVAELESDARKQEISSSLASLGEPLDGRSISIEHVERVKSYAPGVLHCVFDVRVYPKLN